MKAAKTFLAVIFIMAMTFGVKAQNKYEYASVIYHASVHKTYSISISKEGKYEKNTGEVSEESSEVNLTPVIDLVNKMSSDGWEQSGYDVNSQIEHGSLETYYCFILRKKKS